MLHYRQLLQTIAQRRNFRTHQSSHLITSSFCFLFLSSESGSCFLVLPVSHLFFPVQTLGQNNTAMSQEATGRTNTETDGNMHTPFSNKNFHTLFLASPIKGFILSYSLLVGFYCAASSETKKALQREPGWRDTGALAVWQTSKNS